MTLNKVANDLQNLRNRFTAGEDAAEILVECDKIGFWLARQKTGKLAMKLLSEASSLADRCRGGSGKAGVRLIVC